MQLARHNPRRGIADCNDVQRHTPLPGYCNTLCLTYVLRNPGCVIVPWYYE